MRNNAAEIYLQAEIINHTQMLFQFNHNMNKQSRSRTRKGKEKRKIEQAIQIEIRRQKDKKARKIERKTSKNLCGPPWLKYEL